MKNFRKLLEGMRDENLRKAFGVKKSTHKVEEVDKKNLTFKFGPKTYKADDIKAIDELLKTDDPMSLLITYLDHNRVKAI